MFSINSINLILVTRTTFLLTLETGWNRVAVLQRWCWRGMATNSPQRGLSLP